MGDRAGALLVAGRAGGLLVAVALGLALMGGGDVCARAGAETVAIDPLGAAAPVLWNGGVAWEDMQGVRAAAPGPAAVRKLVSFRALGFTYSFSLDSGAGAGGSSNGAGGSGTGAGGSSTGALAYGWEEANDQTPPMGPGDTRVPAPPLPYETSISHRGLIDPAGHVAQLPDCGTQDTFGAFGAYLVSLAGPTVAYLCGGFPPGAPANPHAILPSYLALGQATAPAASPQTVAEASGEFQLAGDFLVYDLGGALASSRRLVVARREAASPVYEVPLPPGQYVQGLALQADGTLVVLGLGTASCPPVSGGASRSFPAEWLSPAEPAPHQLGCFYTGSLRPVAGQWVALAPGPGGQAALELVTLATGASRTLAVFANAAIAEPQPQQVPPTRYSPGFDFDGQRLAWVQHTCAGAAIELTPDVAAMSPGPPSPTRCPLRFHVHSPLRPDARGRVRVPISCPLGCTLEELRLRGPHGLAGEASPFATLPPSPRPRSVALRLSRRALAQLRRRGRVRVTISALSAGLGSARSSKTAVRVTLAR